MVEQKLFSKLNSGARFRHNTFPAVIVIMTLLVSCVSTGEPNKQASGNNTSESELNDSSSIDSERVIENFKNANTDDERRAIVQNLSGSSNPAAADALGEILNLEDVLSNAKLKYEVVQALKNQESDRSTEVLHQNVRKRTLFMDEELLNYFVNKKYRPAADSIIENIEAGYDPVKGMDALVSLGGERAEAYLLSVARDKDHPANLVALEKLSEMGETRGSRDLILSILKKARTSTEPGLPFALDSIVKWGYDKEIWDLMDRLRISAEDAKLKRMVTDTMFRMKKDTSHLSEGERHMPLAYYQAGMSLWFEDSYKQLLPLPEIKEEVSATNAATSGQTLQESYIPDEAENEKKDDSEKEIFDSQPNKAKKDSAVHPVKSTARNPVKKKKSSSRRNKKNVKITGKSFSTIKTRYKSRNVYRDAVYSTLINSMGEERGRTLYYRINNALQAYSEDSSLIASFLNRSYQRKFNTDEKKSRELIGEGMSRPGSLGAIVDNLRREYKGNKLQIYALASIFNIPRWQSELIIELTEEKGF